MKKGLVILLAIMVSCSTEQRSNKKTSDNEINDRNNPVAIAIAFNNSINQGRIKEAEAYSTEASQLLLEQAALAGRLPADPDYKSALVSDSIAGNRAIISLRKEGGTSITPYHLVRIDGEWKVDMAATSDAQRAKRLKQYREEKKAERLKK